MEIWIESFLDREGKMWAENLEEGCGGCTVGVSLQPCSGSIFE